MKIGIFDSGVGGQSVANAIHRELPELEILVREDKENLPYGNKTPEELTSLVVPILESMVQEGCELVVIACNTVTTNIIESLRNTIQVPLIGMEPMIKTAASNTKTNIITVCATPATLRSKRYKYLKDTFAKDIKVLEPDCSKWASMIEANNLNKEDLRSTIKPTLDAGSDVIVLGCTHYHWIEDDIKDIASSQASVLQPEVPVIEQLKRVIEQLT